MSRADQTRIQTGRPMCVLSFVTQKTGHKENKLLSSPTKLCCSLTYLNLFFFSPPLLLARLSFLQRKQLMIKSDRNAMSFCDARECELTITSGLCFTAAARQKEVIHVVVVVVVGPPWKKQAAASKSSLLLLWSIPIDRRRRCGQQINAVGPTHYQKPPGQIYDLLPKTGR